jgi:hypothetical protein
VATYLKSIILYHVKNVNTQNLKISDLWLVICNSNGNLYSCIACF